MVNKIQVN